MSRDVPWYEVKKFLRERREAAMTQLLGCPLDNVERIRGRVEAYQSLLQLENLTPDEPPSTAVMFIEN